MKFNLTNNWGLKLGSLVFAFFLWIIVTNLNDPVIQFRAYNVPVRFTNTNVITDQGKVYEVLNDTDVIDYVVVSASRSIIDKIDNDDIVAVADFKDLTLQDTVAIQLSTSKYGSSLESITGNIDTVELNIENLKTKTLALATITTGTVSDGYIVGDISLAQNQVRVSGPESVINQIVGAQAEISVTGFTQDIVTDADIRLVDAEGNTIDSNSLDCNIDTVKVNAAILQTMKLPLSFSSIGIPAEGYASTGKISSVPDSILVAGKASVLSSIDEIEIPAEALNITGATGDLTTLVNVSNYLPNGVTLADSTFSGNTSVTVYVEKTIDKRLSLSANAIKWENIPEGYKIELVDPENLYDVTINGLRAVINNTNAEDITAIANLKDVLEEDDVVGNLYHTNLNFISSNGDITVKSPVQIWFKLTKE